MRYFIIILFCILIFILFFKISSVNLGSTFSKGTVIDRALLKQKVEKLAVDSKSYRSGYGLGVYRVRQAINKAVKAIYQKVKNGEELFRFEEMLYDNFYLLQSLLKKLSAMQRRFIALPGERGEPRIYTLAKMIVQGSGAKIDYALIKNLSDIYNAETKLTFKETSLFKETLQFCLIEYLAAVCVQICEVGVMLNKGARDAKFDRIDLSAVSDNAYLYGLYKNVKDKNIAALKSVCVENGCLAQTRVDNFFEQLSYFNADVSEAISSLRKVIDEFDDMAVLKLCPVYDMLSSRKGIVFDEVTTATKFYYLNRISEIAAKKKIQETTVTAEAIESAELKNTDISEALQVKKASKAKAVIYLTVLSILTVGLCAVIAAFVPRLKILTAVINAPLIFIVLHMIAGFIVGHLRQSLYLPRLDLENTSANISTMIVYTGLADSKQSVEELYQNLLTTVRANPQDCFSYALLLDLKPSSQAQYSPQELEVIDTVSKLYSNHQEGRFNFFLRKRVRNTRKNKYEGWEKKRGALLDLNELILSGNTEKFELALGTSYSVKYVLTLDADSLMNCAYEAVSVMAHPCAEKISVLSLNMTADPYRTTTRFGLLFNDSMGLDGYSGASNGVMTRFFNAPNYTGKGIYRVEKFHSALKDFFMDERILSHDFIEGAVSGAEESGLYGLDEYPSRISKFLLRAERWARGDVQLLPYLFKRVRNRSGEKIKNPLSIGARFHIFVNIVSVLTPLCSLIGAVLFIFTRQWVYLPLAFMVPIAGAVLSLRLAVIIHPTYFLREMARLLYSVVLLPSYAFYYTSAFIKTLFRLLRKKNLLNWTPSKIAVSNLALLPNLIASVAAAIVLLWGFNGIALTFSIVWFCAVFIDAVLAGSKKNKISSDEKEFCLAAAKRIWAYYEDMLATENFNGLPYDNLDETKALYADRTSPTNIGMLIASLICAEKLGFVDTEYFEKNTDKILSRLENLEKWRGLFYNWTRVSDCQTLLPKYVSSVDNGNLMLSLTALTQTSHNLIASRAQRLLDAMDMSALFDAKRGLLRIGYNDSAKEYDFNHYDLVSSEALATYLICIGLNKIDKAAFYNLDFERVRYAGDVFQSWTGGAFEFLMMPLFYTLPRGGVRRSVKNSVKAQVKYAQRLRLPVWGISECCYNRRDESGNYAYKAFGVTDIAHSDFGEGRVVSAYSSIMALPFYKDGALKNLRTLKDRAYGKYGFYEALDFDRNGTVQCYMTHHLGMSLLALTDFVENDFFKNLMDLSPAVRAGKLLLTMKKDDTIAKKKFRMKYKRAVKNTPSAALEKMYDFPYYNLLGERDYRVAVDETGCGFSLYKGQYVYRFDGRFDGVKISLECDGKSYNCYQGSAVHYPHKTEYRLNEKDFSAVLTVETLSNYSGEVRRIEVFNKTAQTKTFCFKTMFDAALAAKRDFLSHVTFSKMKLRSEFLYELNAMTIERAGGAFKVTHFFDDTHAEFDSNRQNILFHTQKPSFGEVLDIAASGQVSFDVVGGASCVKSAYIVAYENAPQEVIEAVRALSFTREDQKAAFIYERESDLSAGKTFSRLYFGQTAKTSPVGANSKYPVVAVKIKSAAGKDALLLKLKYLKKLMSFGLDINLFILYDEKFGYRAEMLECINACLFESGIYHALGGESTLSIVNEDSEKERTMRVYESAQDLTAVLTPLSNVAPLQSAPVAPAPLTTEKIQYPMDNGGFLEDGAYLITKPTQRCWSNIVCDESFGFIVTNNGGGYTYYDNSRQNKISDFSNDPLLDPPSELIMLGEKNLLWSVTRRPNNSQCDFIVKHGFGQSQFVCNYNGVIVTTRVYLYPSENTKFYEIDINNPQKFDRHIDAAFFVRPVMGDFLFETRRNIEITRQEDGVTVDNSLGAKRVYIRCNEFISSFAQSFEGACSPDGTIARIKNFTCCGATPCAAVGCSISIGAEKSKKIVFTLGTNAKIRPEMYENAKEKTRQVFENLSFIDVNFAGNPALGYLMKWLPYQVYSSRFNGRTGFYQAGGAVGFRDQLQDCLAILYINPQKVREHILLCAARQFPEGDVMHWWHAPRTGVRTNICDDKLFLPYLTAEYLSFTNDYTVLSETVPYLDGKALAENQHSVYFEAQPSAKSGSILKHCLDAIDSALGQMGGGLVKMGGGDWNDAMDKVGEKGKGVSVWCSMFLYFVISKFLPYVGEATIKKRLLDEKLDLYEAVNNCFQGEWFVRAYKDNGAPIGVRENEECKIDLLTQSWAQISGVGEYDKTKSGLKNAYRYLVDEKNMLIKLLTPPFKKDTEIGYISSYPEGVRENGGQYTHAAAWYIRALFEAGHCREAIKLLELINPVRHGENGYSQVYEAEPYVMCGDVYAGNFCGQGGWSWYTGSASILYECIVKNLLGIKINGDKMTVSPNITEDFGDVEITVRTKFGDVKMKILSQNAGGKWVAQINGVQYNTAAFVLSQELIGKNIIIRSQNR